jgi:hypothetical protein
LRVRCYADFDPQWQLACGSSEERERPEGLLRLVGGHSGLFRVASGGGYGGGATHAVPAALQTMVPVQGVQAAAPVALTQYTSFWTQAFPQRCVPVRGSALPAAQTNEHA